MRVVNYRLELCLLVALSPAFQLVQQGPRFRVMRRRLGCAAEISEARLAP
jgi:hypothetical protein